MTPQLRLNGESPPESHFGKGGTATGAEGAPMSALASSWARQAAKAVARKLERLIQQRFSLSRLPVAHCCHGGRDEEPRPVDVVGGCQLQGLPARGHRLLQHLRFGMGLDEISLCGAFV